METVLGLSMTSTSVGWVLVDGSEANGATLDHDAFDLGTGVTSERNAQQAVAVRGAQAIAAASGHEVRSIGVTWTDDAEVDAKGLLESLRHSGWDNLVPVPLSQAAGEWAQGVGRELGYEMAAVCIIEPTTVTLVTVDTGDGAPHTDVTHARDSAPADGLSQWLTAMFDRGHQPDSVLLVGSGSDLDAIKGALDDALPMPVVASVEAQLVLARGAALAFVKPVDVTDVGVGKRA